MRLRLLIIALFACVAAAMLLSRGVWAPDEARYGEVAREMKGADRWLVPILNGETYAEKPPLFFALIRIFSVGSDGVPEWAAKAPSLLSALGTLLLIGWLAQRLCGGGAGWVAPLLLGTMGKFAWQSQFGQIDMLVTFLVVAQICVGWVLGEGDIGRLTGISGMALLGFCGVLAKGPVGCVLPWLVLASFWAFRRDWPSLRRSGLPWVILAVVALSAGWLLLAGFNAGWDYPETLLFRQTLRRYLDPWHHKAPWYFFAGVLFADGLPYSLFLIPLGIALWKTKSWKSPPFLLPVLWVAVYILVFSASSGKRSVYLLPAFPAVALLVAHGAERWSDGTFPRRGFRTTLAVLFGVVGAGILYALTSLGGQFRGFLPWLLAGGIMALAGAFVSLLLSSKPRAALASVACGMALMILVAGIPGIRRLDAIKRPTAFIGPAAAALASGGRVGVFPSLVPSVNFYLRSPTPVFTPETQSEASAFLAGRPSNLLLVQEGKWAGPPPPHRRLQRAPIGSDGYELWAPSISTSGGSREP